VQQINLPPLERGWFWKWLAREKDLTIEPKRKPQGPPREILEQFGSVTDLGVREITDRKRVLRRVQIFECRGLREISK
jgi:hypothetical protein